MDHIALEFVEEYGDPAPGVGDLRPTFRSGEQNASDDEADADVTTLASV